MRRVKIKNNRRRRRGGGINSETQYIQGEYRNIAIEKALIEIVHKGYYIIFKSLGKMYEDNEKMYKRILQKLQ